MNPTPVPICPQTGPFSVLCFQASGFSGVIGAIITLILVLGVAIALFYLLWGAVRWINSGGDKAEVEGARGHIIGAIIGLIVLLITLLLIAVILGFFGINITEIVIPRLSST